MKRLSAIIFALAMLLGLTACSLSGRSVTVWRAVSPYYLESGAAVQSEPVSVDASLSDIDAAVAAFNSDSTDAELVRALPDGVSITGWELEDGELRLYVSAEYAAVTGAGRSIGDACMALTFCAVEGVESVSVYSGDTLLTANMRPEDVLLADGSGTGQ